jgi:hypothetical protein
LLKENVENTVSIWKNVRKFEKKHSLFLFARASGGVFMRAAVWSLVLLFWSALGLNACRNRGFHESAPFESAAKPTQGKAVQEMGECAQAASSAVLTHWPELKPIQEELSVQMEIDCNEASLISDLASPTRDAYAPLEKFSQLISLFPGKIDDRALQIIRPYCRKGHSLYGDFCMASDLSAAHQMTLDTATLAQVPAFVLQAGLAIAEGRKVDYLQVAKEFFPQDAARAVLLGSFAGLDDNALQFDRLKANLLFLRRYEDYSKVFPAASQYVVLPPLDGKDYSRAFMSLLFGTRVGQAAPGGSRIGEKQTYKTYSGAYLGCELAKQKLPRGLVVSQGAVLGYSYQMIKIVGQLGASAQVLLGEVKKRDALGKDTATKMKLGSEIGFDACTQKAKKDADTKSAPSISQPNSSPRGDASESL